MIHGLLQEVAIYLLTAQDTSNILADALHLPQKVSMTYQIGYGGVNVKLGKI